MLLNLFINLLSHPIKTFGKTKCNVTVVYKNKNLSPPGISLKLGRITANNEVNMASNNNNCSVEYSTYPSLSCVCHGFSHAYMHFLKKENDLKEY